MQTSQPRPYTLHTTHTDTHYTDTQTDTERRTKTHAQLYIYICTQTNTGKHTNTRTHIYRQICTRTHTDTYGHTKRNTHARTRTPTHIGSHISTSSYYTQSQKMHNILKLDNTVFYAFYDFIPPGTPDTVLTTYECIFYFYYILSFLLHSRRNLNHYIQVLDYHTFYSSSSGHLHIVYHIWCIRSNWTKHHFLY